MWFRDHSAFAVVVTVGFALLVSGLGTPARGETVSAREALLGDDWTAISGTADLLGEWGDAPESSLAYPSLGVIGGFPTCGNVPPPLSFIYHGNLPPAWAYFGLGEDYELEGNADTCFKYPASKPFPPYDVDECFQDGDAGLAFPPAYTIKSGVVVPCVAGQTGAIGPACSLAVWGRDIDIDVVHSGTPSAMAYINIVVDWDQSGGWGAPDTCYLAGGPVAVPEHILMNWGVPPGFAGRLSALGAPPFRIGPNSGYVWARFMISESPFIPPIWDGSGVFEGGESEDYLLLVGQTQMNGEWGDAPDSALAYPTGIVGNFPTCQSVGPPGSFVYHQPAGTGYFGPSSDFESEGNANNCLNSPAFPPYDADECFDDGDAGLLYPAAYTMQGTSAVPCTTQTGYLVSCKRAVWGTDIDIQVNNYSAVDMYANGIADWNQDGYWSGYSLCPRDTAYEHILVNFPVPPGFNQNLSNLSPPSFLVGPDTGFVWIRLTISPTPVVWDWDGVGNFTDGESEDYLVHVVDVSSVGDPETLPSHYSLYANSPNPFYFETFIGYDLPRAARAKLAIYDVAGRLVNTLVDGYVGAGEHLTVWDGTDASGKPVSGGVYFYRLTAGEFSAMRKMVLVHTR